ncbi:hypothetical protein [Dysgonomonas macrotermitis]|uniref:YD repeat-containing protein n=1 Tax=Dysgonomonas macrotermitis TaxID=1346286 RepID=A0A1M4W6Q2_9BACT|nr:hypothetical protein [Dysgonomonas macrotermitis]SHE76964.1 hypothetical protein SAMN05444362_102144 [Dysgonomonas macrotermitis]
MYVKEASGWTVNYIGRDYLGSITHVMDQTGVVRQELSYDPWGRLRDPLTQALFELDKRLTLVLGDRGYTGHEPLWAKLPTKEELKAYYRKLLKYMRANTSIIGFLFS